MGVWPQFRSPLVWDVFAVSTYATVSLLFWYVGLIPDLATLRDRSKIASARAIYGILAMGWRGSARHWHRYEMAYLLLAGLATPLVSRCTRWSVSTSPWHCSRLAHDHLPALFRGRRDLFRLCHGLTLAIPIRAIYGLEDFITMRHLQNMAKIMLATGLIVAYGYMMEAFMAWYSGESLRSAL